MTDAATPTFLIFSGHNDRAAIALCRFFELSGVDFVVAARPAADRIRNSRYADRIVFTRQTSVVNLRLFEDIAQAAGRGQLVYCPTTEFINLFLLSNRPAIESLGFVIPLPEAALYHDLSNKKSAGDFFAKVPELTVPKEIAMDQVRAPCVLKPNKNLRDGVISYPHLFYDDQALTQFLRTHDTTGFFAQEFVTGASFYLCGCMDRNGVADSFWQRNLGQQPNGKSIVLAREEVTIPKDLSNLRDDLETRLKEVGYLGPFMIEIRRHGTVNYFIEINPRFWGPLQLSLDVCPDLLARFVRLSVPEFEPKVCRLTQAPCFYSWKEGLVDWEALDDPTVVAEAFAQADSWDVFNRKDYAYGSFQ